MPEDAEEGESPLDQALRVRQQIASSIGQDIQFNKYPEFMDLLYELNDHGRSAGPDLAQKLGTNISVLNKFFTRSSIDQITASKVADRMVTHLRSTMSDYRVLDGGHQITALQRLLDEPERPFVVKALEWKTVVRSSEIQEKINHLIALIGDVIVHASTTNLPPDQRALTDIERAQLIAVLETALNVLKSPMIEKGLLKKASGMVKRAVAQAAEKQTEIAFSAAGGALVAAIVEFAKHL